MEAIKRVYASTFSQHAKAYVRATPYRLEEEKMAVILQQVVGTAHGKRFYPDFSGVVRSHNFYPGSAHEVRRRHRSRRAGPGARGGRWRQVSDLLPAVSPTYSCSSPRLKIFWRTRKPSSGPWNWITRTARPDPAGPTCAKRASGWMRPRAMERLIRLGSTYSADNHAIYDGLSRPGTRMVSFAPILKHGVFPLALDSRSTHEESEKTRLGARWKSSLRCVCRNGRRKPPISDFSRFGRWCFRAKAKRLRIDDVDAAGCSAKARRCWATGGSRICATLWSSTFIASNGPAARKWPKAWRTSMPSSATKWHSLSADRRWTLGIERSLAGHSRGMGRNLRRARDRRSGIPRFSRHPIRRAAISFRT